MSYNISHEAVFPPAVHNLRRMSHLSPTRNVTKGSYELYDSQKALDSTEKKVMNISVGAAPGSPSSFHDYNQVVETLQHELEHSKRKESDLQQMLADLKNPLSHTSTMFLDNSYLEASPSNDSLGENVKDAHIRHLQRQVTVLQASLYKSEGWVNRVAVAIKERDKAQDDVVHLTNRIKEMQEKNNNLSQKVESLSTTLQETHKNLLQVTEHLHNQNYNGQLVMQLKDEVLKQNYEIKTLKESLNRLDMENRGLKDTTLEGNTQSLGSLTCSQELEHLHKVVDRLKSTVLQQRSYLLQLRPPSYCNTPKSATGSPGYMTTDVYMDQDSVSGRNSVSPQLRGPAINLLASERVQSTQPHQAMYGQPSQALMMKSGSPKETIDVQQTQYHGSNDFVQDGATAGRKQFSSREMLEEIHNMDVHNLQNSLFPQGGMEHRHIPQKANINGYSYAATSQNPNGHFMQQMQGDLSMQTGRTPGFKAANGYEPLKSQYRVLQNKSPMSETLAEKNGFEAFNQTKMDTKLDAVGKHVREWNLSSANNSATDADGDSDDIVTSSQIDRGVTPIQGQRHKSPVQKATIQQEARIYESNKIPVEKLGKTTFDGNDPQMLIDNDTLTQFGNLNLNSAVSQSQQVYHSLNYQLGPVHIINHDKMAGGKMTIPTHNLTSQGTGISPDNLYVNAPGNQRISTATSNTSPANQDDFTVGPNPDRLCPVCNNDYSHVSMEDFQSHIFECIDDEHSPETMKPFEPPDRTCPMCNATFVPAVTQTEYEKHVHGHFGEEGPGDNFEILQP